MFQLFFILFYSCGGSSFEKVRTSRLFFIFFYSFGGSSLEKLKDVSAILHTFPWLWGGPSLRESLVMKNCNLKKRQANWVRGSSETMKNRLILQRCQRSQKDTFQTVPAKGEVSFINKNWTTSQQIWNSAMKRPYNFQQILERPLRGCG